MQAPWVLQALVCVLESALLHGALVPRDERLVWVLDDLRSSLQQHVAALGAEECAGVAWLELIPR